MSEGQLEVCVIGAGPRGLSVLERLCANAREGLRDTTVLVHLVDPHPPGAGGVWRTDQSPHLLMNTVASQVTLFTDESVEIDGVLVPGPSLYEWASFIRLMGPMNMLDYQTVYPDEVLAEARELTADSYPTRALYGHYLGWMFRRVVREAPAHVSVVVHPLRAVQLGEDEAGRQSVRLADGSRIRGLDAVVLAQGHLPSAAGADELDLAVFAAKRDLTYISPSNPADVDLTAVHPGQPVALRGLGLNFFDYLALFTIGRGGTFVRRDDGTLDYRPSGDEPRLYASSRRGVPYHSRGRNQKGAYGRHQPLLLTPDVIARLRKAGSLDFGTDLWPLIAKETETVYYAALLARRECCCEAGRFRDRYLPQPWGSEQEGRLLAEFGIGAGERWDWQRISQPYGERTFTGTADFREWLTGVLREDVAAAQEGNIDGPVKAALDVLRDLRNEIRLLVDHGGLTGRSYRDDLERWYTPLNAFLSIGPPVQRIEQMIALIEAGVLDVLGPGMRVTADQEHGAFAVESTAVPGSRIHVTTLIEARLPGTDVRQTTDPLVQDLLATGQAAPYRIADPELGAYETGGLAVTDRPYHLVREDGTAHPRRFAYGVPTEAVHWVTAAGVRPGVNSVTLGDSDAIALAVLSLAGSVAGPDPVLPPAETR